MDDLISRQRTINAIIKMLGIADESFLLPAEKAIVDCIKSQPSSQPKRTGHWVGIDDEPCEVFECDICGKTYDTCGYTWDLPNYCPNCGAKMEGGTR